MALGSWGGTPAGFSGNSFGGNGFFAAPTLSAAQQAANTSANNGNIAPGSLASETLNQQLNDPNNPWYAANGGATGNSSIDYSTPGNPVGPNGLAASFTPYTGAAAPITTSTPAGWNMNGTPTGQGQNPMAFGGGVPPSGSSQMPMGGSQTPMMSGSQMPGRTGPVMGTPAVMQPTNMQIGRMPVTGQIGQPAGTVGQMAQMPNGAVAPSGGQASQILRQRLMNRGSAQSPTGTGGIAY